MKLVRLQLLRDEEAIRMIYSDLILALLFGLLALETMALRSFNILLLVAGVALGALGGTLSAKSMIGRIDVAGGLGLTRKRIILLMAAVVVYLLPAILIIVYLGINAGYAWLGSFAFPFVFAVFAARMALFLNWERSNLKILVSEGRILHAVPKHS